MILTSNRDVDEWGSLFHDALLALAAIDRRLHHATIVEMEGESYRNPYDKRNRTGKPTKKCSSWRDLTHAGLALALMKRPHSPA